jgi:hypothetical protein
MAAKFPKGAEWRIWDLQVHTPFSELNNGFGDDHEAYAKAFFLTALEKKVAVVGVTDYFVVDGYRFLKQLQLDDARLTALIGADKLEAAKAITLFANVELRTDILIDGNRVNYHVIFSDEVSSDDILDNFLAQLHFTCEGNPSGVDQQLSLTRKNLESLGKTLRAQHQKFEGMTDIFVGMMQATVDHKEVSEVLSKREGKFGGKTLFCVPCDEDLSNVSWDGQGHMTRKILIQKSDILFTSNKNTREFALGLKHPSPEDYLKEFLAFKPCVHSSEAHKLSDLFEPAQGRLTWIKADPTFKGLMQTLNEPDTRVYIGTMPPGVEGVRNRPTKIVKDLTTQKRAGSSLTEKWFDQKLELNSELIAIIGNKGSGKSALADILGLLGNTPRSEAFSFLSPDRFKDRKLNKAKHFEATATWVDGKVDGPVSLDDTPRDGAVETIKYIPQTYLERICNEVSLGSGSKFYEELQSVIFSHVPEAEQLGFSSLDELLQHRSEQTKKTIDLLMDQLKGINRELASIEELLTEAHRRSIEEQLLAKQREIDAHELTKPSEQTPPLEDPAVAQSATEVGAELQRLQSQLAEIEAQIAQARQQRAHLTKRRTTAERLLGKLQNVGKQLRAAAADAVAELDELDLKWTDLVKVDIESTTVEGIITQAASGLANLAKQLDSTNDEGLLGKQEVLKGSIDTLGDKLSAPQRAHEAHKAAMKRWEEARNSLVGTPEQLGSLNQLKEALTRIPTLKEREKALGQEQIDKAKEIYREKEKLRDDYGRYYVYFR